LENGEIHCQLNEILSMVRSLAFSPDSHFLLAGSIDAINELILWDVQSCKLVRRFELKDGEDATGFVFSSDGKWVATGSVWCQRTILWDVGSGREIQRFTHEDITTTFPIMDVALSQDNRPILAPGPNSLELWDIEAGMIIRRYSGQTGLVMSVDISPDGKLVLASSNNGEVILWDFSTGEELYRLSAHSTPVLSAKFSPDSKYVYSISTDGLLTKWTVPTFRTAPELLDWIQANRYVRELTCAEKLQYRVEPLCEQENP
jgi:WD40 repeat protein